MLGLLQHAARSEMGPKEDPPFILKRTMGGSGHRVRPDGFDEGRICRLCGVVFFPPIEVPEEKRVESEGKGDE